jgi:MoaA/NifB/PqqE/SkfB family radical SAM enzyme
MKITPKKISIEISTLCNLSCEMCFLAGFRRKEITGAKEDAFFSLDLFKGLVDEISEKFPVFQNTSFFSFNFTGGETFLHPKILEMLEYARGKNIGVTVFTNGTLIDLAVAADIVKAKPAALMFSIDGPREIHDQIRGQGNFEKACQAINLIQSQKRLFNAREPRIYINTLINNLTVDHLEDMIFIGDALKIDGLFFSHIQWSTPESSALVQNEFKERLGWSAPLSRMVEAMEHNLSVGADQLDRLLVQVDLIKNTHRNRNSFFVNFLPDLSLEEIALWYSPDIYKIDFCTAPAEWLRIGVNGDVQPVCALAPFPFGNLNEKFFQKIIDSREAKKFFDEIEANGFFYACQRCCRRPARSRSLC